MKKRFLDKTVIVTGASSGIGAAVARQFAAEGAHLVLVARRREALEALACDIGRENALVVPMDVTDLTAAAALFERAETHFGAIHVLVNNAGIHNRGVVDQRQVPELLKMIDVNLRAPVALCRLVLPCLRRAGGGAIVNMGSLAGRITVAGAATYGAAKSALRAFSLTLAEELRRHHITVSIVSPGPVNTDIFREGFDKVPDLFFSPPLSSAEQVAELVLACAYDGKPERVIPRRGAWMATLGSLCPPLRRTMRPLLEWVGRRHKQQYLRSKRT